MYWLQEYPLQSTVDHSRVGDGTSCLCLERVPGVRDDGAAELCLQNVTENYAYSTPRHAVDEESVRCLHVVVTI